VIEGAGTAAKNKSQLPGPLEGVRVLSLGGVWAGRLASLLLADQGAEVIEINRPSDRPTPARSLLSRGKREIELDLKSESGQRAARDLAQTADILIENLGRRRCVKFGLSFPSLQAINEKLVYVSIPGFASETGEDLKPASEGAIAASVGVYTDIHALGPALGGDPIFTAVPMASAYGGVHASIAASAAYFHRLRSGRGSFVEVPLADALLSAMALLAMKINDQPRYFDLPPVDKSMSDVAFPILRDLNSALSPEHRASIRSYVTQFAQPLFANHRCGDGHFIFINAIGHVHQPRACLEVLGILDTLIAEGMVVASPYDVGKAGNNISDAGGLSTRWKRRLYELMSVRLLTKSSDEWERLLQAAGVPVSIVRSADEWLNWPMAQEGGNVARVADPDLGETLQAGRFVTIQGEGSKSPDLRARSRGRGVWTTSLRLPEVDVNCAPDRILKGVRVLDLSNVIAGPVAARILAELGAEVTRVDPVFPQAGPRMTLWFGLDVNQGKKAVIVDLKTPQGQEILANLVARSDIVVHNYLDRSLSGIGISDDRLRTINPNIITCQVSAWAGPNGGAYKDFPAYDPVLQAATGVTARYGGSPTAPVIHGLASCVDYITGFSAALGVIQAMVAKALGRGAANVQTSLAMGAQLVQFPFMVRGGRGEREFDPQGQQVKGYGPHYQLYKARDGWFLLSCRKDDLSTVASALDAEAAKVDELANAFQGQLLSDIQCRLEHIQSASAVRVRRLDTLRDMISVREDEQRRLHPEGGGLTMIDAAHPSGHRVTLPLPSWYRSPVVEGGRLNPAPKPGANTVEVLKEIGYGEDEIDALGARGIVAGGWPVTSGYFPPE
jgi:crotonobetainyl-CoA:carnitine CoA-transferase CaiB-like acyl-CoA transferase